MDTSSKRTKHTVQCGTTNDTSPPLRLESEQEEEEEEEEEKAVCSTVFACPLSAALASHSLHPCHLLLSFERDQAGEKFPRALARFSPAFKSRTTLLSYGEETRAAAASTIATHIEAKTTSSDVAREHAGSVNR